MEHLTLSVLVVDRDDYKVFMHSAWGLSDEVLAEADLVIDRDTKRVLKSDGF